MTQKNELENQMASGRLVDENFQNATVIRGSFCDRRFMKQVCVQALIVLSVLIPMIVGFYLDVKGDLDQIEELELQLRVLQLELEKTSGAAGNLGETVAELKQDVENVNGTYLKSLFEELNMTAISYRDGFESAGDVASRLLLLEKLSDPKWNPLNSYLLRSSASPYNMSTLLPEDARMVLLEVFVVNLGECATCTNPDWSTTYLEVSTKEDDVSYSGRVSIYTSIDHDNAINSQLIWLPVTSDKMIYTVPNFEYNLNVGWHIRLAGYK